MLIRCIPNSKTLFRLSTILVLLVFVLSSHTSALPIEQKEIFNRGILYFDHAIANRCIPTTNAGFSGELIGSSNEERIWNWLLGQGLSQIQAAGILGNFKVESGFSPTRQEDGKAWPTYGYGLAQWSFGRRLKLREGLPAELIPYYVPDYGGAAQPSGKHILLPDDINLKFLEYELQFMLQESQTRTVSASVARLGLGTQGANEWETMKQQQTVEDAVVFWHNNFEVSAQTPLSVLQSRLPAAKSALEKYSTGGQGPLAPVGSGGSVATSGCLLGGSAATSASVSGVIAKIKEFAWPYSTRGMPFNSQATQAYQDAAAQHFPGGYGDMTLADCTYFVATVMRASGADPSFPIGTPQIRSYLLNNTDKYEIITNPQAWDLQPGDILQHIEAGSNATGSWRGHIMFYTGDLDGTGQYVASDASKYTRVPGYLEMSSINVMMTKPSTIIARLKTQ